MNSLSLSKFVDRDAPVVILGGGLSGLACADALGEMGVPFIVIEEKSVCGGLTPTISFEGCRFELGPHVYFKADQEITAFWRGLGRERFRTHLRQTKLFYNGRFINSPLQIPDALRNIGFVRISKMVLGYLKQKILFSPSPRSAKDWMIQNFGAELYDSFFKVYNEKIWGIPCERLDPAWAGQRVKTSLWRIIIATLFRKRGQIVKEFDFPDTGSGILVEALTNRVRESGCGEIRISSKVRKLVLEGGNVVRVEVGEESGASYQIQTDCVVSTLPPQLLFGIFDPLPPTDSFQRLEGLKYRNLVLVLIVADASDVLNFSEHWIDIHDEKIKALRVTNFANYHGAGMAPPGKSAVAVEYNTSDGDEIELLDDDGVCSLARSDLAAMGILSNVCDVKIRVLRTPFAYPVYEIGFQENYSSLKAWLAENVRNLHLTGRNGLFRWNNMHHSVKTGQLTARKIAVGDDADIDTISASI